jgi:predicted MPP superfamily phosphohydrolase
MPWAIRMIGKLSLVALPLFLYVGFRLAGSIGLLSPALKGRAYLFIFLAIGWVYSMPIVAFASNILGVGGATLFQRSTVGWTDYLFQFPFWVGVIVVLELTAPFLLADIVGAAAGLSSTLSQKVRPALPTFRVVVTALLVLYVPVRVFFDTTRVHDAVERVSIKGLPPELAGLSITLISDIQVDQYTAEGKVEQVRHIVQGRPPDLLFSGGDLVTSGTRFLGAASRAICGLSGSVATVAVMGDHDYWSAPDAIADVYRRCGWTFLDNGHRLYSYHGKNILVTGLTHVYSDRLTLPALRDFLGTAPQADLRVLLVHQPAEQVVRLASELGYHLVLAGHTHGGQIVIHPLGVPFTPSMTETHYYQGIYQNGGTTVVVTRGVGLTLAPVRYHAPAEITTLLLSTDSPTSGDNLAARTHEY